MREPENHRTMLAAFPDADTATRAVSMIIASGIVPAAIEMMDQLIIRAVEEAFHVGLPLDAGAVLIIELEGLEAGLTAYADEVAKIVSAAGALEASGSRATKPSARCCGKRANGLSERSAGSRQTTRPRTAWFRARACRGFCA